MGSGDQSQTIGWQDLKRSNAKAGQAILIWGGMKHKTGDDSNQELKDATLPAIWEGLSHSLLCVSFSEYWHQPKSLLCAPFVFEKRVTTAKQLGTSTGNEMFP
mmetsp:Transcript_11061/g.25670  ORF Transcript_11061/g.25670 Transcript_11061/m.25670 type:complete len:103 (-) Transcript_11061:141-449(-)